MEGTFEGTSGTTIATRSWRPEGKARAVLVVQHGLLSHSGRYQWVAEQFVAKGIAVHALDLRGHGKSGGDRYWVDRFDEFVEDLDRFVKQVKAAEPGLPVFLLGHSAGGLVACLYALDHPGELAGLVCESYAFLFPVPEAALLAIRGLAWLLPKAAVLNLNPADFSRDPKVVEDMKADPLINHDPGPAKMLAEMVAGRDRLAENLARLTVPLLVLHGTADKATSPRGSQRLQDGAGSKDKTLKLYDGHFHDPLADVGKEGVLADIAGWIDARIPAA